MASRWVWRGLLVTFLLWALVNLHWGRGIAWDEVEFLQATDRVRMGLVPYRDFFEHHTPLTWFLMAPFEWISHGPGVGPILWLRWVQVPLWGLALWRLNIWMQEDGAPAWARLCALACLLGTPLFVFSALEYRVDTLGTLLVVLGLDRLRRPDSRSAWVAGALLSLSVIANLRFAPFVVVVALAASCMNLEVYCWRLQPSRLGRLALGAALATVPWGLYLLATHSFGAMWQQCFIQNGMAHQLTKTARMTGVFLSYPLGNADFPGLLLEGGMILAGWSFVRSIRRPRFLHLIFLAQVANFAFVAVMKAQYLYHLELSLCLAVPLLAESLARAAMAPGRRRAIQGVCVAVLSLGAAMNVFNLVARNDHDTLKYQDRVLREAARIAPPASMILDGCGWLLDRRPAYTYWFLPLYVRNLSLRHQLMPYTPEDFRRNPPRLVVSNLRLVNWLWEWPDIGLLITTHYLPTLPNLWVPGLSYPFSPDRRQWTWTVPVTGDYQLLCRPNLSEHPWFPAPLWIVTQSTRISGKFTLDPQTFESHGQENLRWVLDGQSTTPLKGRLHLAKGQQLSVVFSGSGSMGVMLVPDGTGPLFQPTPPGANLDYLIFSSYYRPF